MQTGPGLYLTWLFHAGHADSPTWIRWGSQVEQKIYPHGDHVTKNSTDKFEKQDKIRTDRL